MSSLAPHTTGRVFILGAGFSAAAGIPMTAPLLREAMEQFRSKSPDLFSRIKDCTQVAFGLGDTEPDYSKLSFAELCTFLDYKELCESGGGERGTDNGSRERLATKYYLARTMVDHTPMPEKVPELYRKFAAQLRPTDIVIPFNWDCLLEAALNAVGAPYTYGEQGERLLIYKMHGSVHWRIGNQLGSLSWRPMKLIGDQNSELFSSDDLFLRDSWHRISVLSHEVEPLIVLPGYGKAKDIADLKWLWYKPEGLFASAAQVYIVGLSMADDDFFVVSLLLDVLSESDKRVTVINPDPKARCNYTFLPCEYLSYRMENFSIEQVQEMELGN